MTARQENWRVLPIEDITLIQFECPGCGFWYEFLLSHLQEITDTGTVDCMWCDTTIDIRGVMNEGLERDYDTVVHPAYHSLVDSIDELPY